MAGTLGKDNPYRYKGYYYDDETGMYYLKSRYYQPEICRFISADELTTLSVGQGNFIQYNLYIYCLNNSINQIDEDGHLSLPNWAKIAVGLVTTVAAVGVTVATGGAAVPILLGVAASTLSGAAIGYVTEGKEGAINGATDGFMWGGVGALAASAVGAIKTISSYKKTVDMYSSLRKTYSGTGMEVHHIVEQRLAKGSRWQMTKMPSVALTKTVHRGYTNQWRAQVKYGTRYAKSIAYKYRIYKAANVVYRRNRVLRMAARYIIWKM